MVDYDTYEEFRDPVSYDLECDAFDDDMPVIEQWAQKLGGPLLDVACGTGRMALHMAALGYTVTGVDLIPEMIGHARTKAAERNLSVEWVVSDARDFHLGKRFPFIYMVMNAFQFLYTREAYEALFARIREHLTPEGCFLFETRNATAQNLVRPRETDTFTDADGSRLETIDEAVYDPIAQIQHYSRRLISYRPDGGQEKERLMRVGLRYVYPQELEALLHYNGFKIHTMYGDWAQNPLTAESPAMICVCQQRG
jgi:SAM-dependent methyltransferase